MLTKLFLVTVASGATVYAQTFSLCNPLTKTGCPSDPALAKAVTYDFTKGAPEDFTVSTGSAPTFDSDGAKFTIAKHGDAPTMTSKWYMMFGHYEVVLQTSKGVGTVSSVVLQSDDLDEVDWEWLGADAGNVQTNYYGKGNTDVYNRGQTIPDAGNQDGFHTYSLDWTAKAITWAIDGKVIRTLTPETADTNQYPQTPMQFKLGTWAGGDPAEPAGTIQWAGGKIDYNAGPYTMTVKSVKAIDYSTGKSYSYGDQTGNWQSIKSDGGQINSSGNPDQTAADAPASGTTVSQSGGTSAAKLDNPVASGSAPPTVVPSGSSQQSNGTAMTMATVASGLTSGAPMATGNASLSHTAGAQPTGATTASSGSGSTTSSPSAAAASHANAAGNLVPVAGTGLIAMIAAAMLM